MEVTKIQGFEHQKAEYLHAIGYLVDQVSYWKEYAEDMRHQVEDLGRTIDDCGEDNIALGKKYDEVIRQRNARDIQISEMMRVMRSIQDELQDSLTIETYNMLASVFDLELPFEEV